jgi:hypothetical protein
MADVEGSHEYLVALFDVLGFEHKLRAAGLEQMLAAYRALVDDVVQRNLHMARLFGDMEFSEAPYWTSDGDVFIFNKIQGAFASDSILLWANGAWPEVHGKSPQELAQLSETPGEGWKAHPVPCDNFLDACNELICHSLEIGLPLRGAVAAGQAVIDEPNRIFIGMPIVDAARMEHAQRLIGASLTDSFVKQHVPNRYVLPFTQHLEQDQVAPWGALVLEWPRHWRSTRRSDPAAQVRAQNLDSRHSAYYDKTLDLIGYSQRSAGEHQQERDISIRAQYSQFADPELKVRARAVRRVPIGDVAGNGHGNA